jgi:hypothetical protein
MVNPPDRIRVTLYHQPQKRHFPTHFFRTAAAALGFSSGRFWSGGTALDDHDGSSIRSRLAAAVERLSHEARTVILTRTSTSNRSSNPTMQQDPPIESKPTTDPTVFLVCDDGEKFTVSKEIADMSVTIKDMLAGTTNRRATPRH